MNKKGISAIITTLVLIAVSLAAGSALAAAILKLGTTNLSPALSCTQMQISNPIQIKSACYDQATHQAHVTLYRPFNTEDLSVISLQLGQEHWSCGEATCSTCILPNEGETKALVLETEDSIDQGVSLRVGECLVAQRTLAMCLSN